MGVAPDRQYDAASGHVRLLGVSVFKVQKPRYNFVQRAMSFRAKRGIHHDSVGIWNDMREIAFLWIPNGAIL
jgi:hypothetical protein